MLKLSEKTKHLKYVAAAVIGISACYSYVMEPLSPGYPVTFELYPSEYQQLTTMKGLRDGSASTHKNETAVSLYWDCNEPIAKNIRSYGSYFRSLHNGDIIPVKNRFYRLNSGNAKTASFSILSYPEEFLTGISRPPPGILVPVSGDARLDLHFAMCQLTVEEFGPSAPSKHKCVKLFIDYYSARNGTNMSDVRSEYYEGDLISIDTAGKTPLQSANLRVHRIVAPDPAKHIPGWVELRFEPKDKPASDNPGKEKPASPKTPSQTKSEDTKKPTDTNPKPK